MICCFSSALRRGRRGQRAADIERDPAHAATARTEPSFWRSGCNAANHKQLLRPVWDRDAAGERAPAGPGHGRYDRRGSTSSTQRQGEAPPRTQAHSTNTTHTKTTIITKYIYLIIIDVLSIFINFIY